MTISTQLMSRVRTNIFESTAATGEVSRTDAEIYVWLNDAQHDYVSKLPPAAFPELLEKSAATTFPWTVPANFSEIVEVLVSHTVSGTVAIMEPAFWLEPDQSYLSLRWTDGLGAWAKFEKMGTALVVDAGPQSTTGFVIYRRAPTSINGTNLPCDLGDEHDDAIVNRATAFALQKINDADADFYIKAYEARVAAERAKSGVK